MSISFAKPLFSIGHCLGPSCYDHPLPVFGPSRVSCRQKVSNIALAIGPRCLHQRHKVSDFSCFSLPRRSIRSVAIANGLHSLSAADFPEGGDSDVSCNPDPFSSSSQENCSKKVDTLDLNLPRRSLLVLFTCDTCGSRTKRIINRHAYERGTVFVQCASCEAYHKLVDNLSLVVEYDLRDDPDSYPQELLEG